ncbi:hypothetical protein ACFQ88_12430 [Paenibacillus sp. NPDC056579]
MKVQSSQAAFTQLLISGTLVHEANFNEMKRQLGIELNPHIAICFTWTAI